MSSNHYTPESIPVPHNPQESMLPPQPVTDTQAMAPAQQSQAVSDGITSEKYEAAISEARKSASSQDLKASVLGGVVIGLAASLLTTRFKVFKKQDPEVFKKFMGEFTGYGLGAAVGIAGIKLILNSMRSQGVQDELGQAIAQHEAQQGEFVHMKRNGAALEIPPQPEMAMENYQPTPEEMAQLEAMQQQAMAEIQMLAEMKLDEHAHPAVKQMQGLAQTMHAGKELSPEQQQQAAQLMDEIANSPQLQQEIESSLRKRPKGDELGPDTVEKVSHKAAPSTQGITPESAERVHEAASRELA